MGKKQIIVHVANLILKVSFKCCIILIILKVMTKHYIQKNDLRLKNQFVIFLKLINLDTITIFSRLF